MIKPQWNDILQAEQKKTYFQKLQTEIQNQRDSGIAIFPEENCVFSAFEHEDLSDIKVVILGQDPYHGVSASNSPQAHGLAFSVQGDTKVPPSLVNIYKELMTDIEGFTTPLHGNLTSWADQGVLLLNTVLTVQQAKAHSHAKLGWETFTDEIINQLNEHNSGCVFILWGAHAQKKGKNISAAKHYIIKGPHPSPLSVYRGFYGSKPFSKANAWLASKGKQTINWLID
ncbi:MAG: uracil-DNA glycosylase [Colwellia sp.]